MFTGIVEESGRVAGIEPGSQSIRLAIETRRCARGAALGESIAVNGCCLSVVKISRGSRPARLHFDLLEETWKRTNLQYARVGQSVNLERALAANGRLSGHFVSGHIDGVGQITEWKKQGNDWFLEVAAPKEVVPYLIFKGSIAVDGVSLTVAGLRRNRFSVWIIPHTYEVTALRERKRGDWVNLEADLIGKYVHRLLEGHLEAPENGDRARRGRRAGK